MMDPEADDLGYKFNVNRVSPAHYLNTMKGYKMMPKANIREYKNADKPKFYKKWRRLSHPKLSSFSTTVSTHNEIEEETERAQFVN